MFSYFTMKVLLFVILLISLTSYTVAQDNILTEANDEVIYRITWVEYNIIYSRQWLTGDSEWHINSLMGMVADRLETATNPAVGALIQECVAESINQTNQWMLIVDDHIQIVQDKVIELHQFVKKELMTTNLMTVDFEDASIAFLDRLNEDMYFIDNVLFVNVVDKINSMYNTFLDIRLELYSCLEASQTRTNKALL